MRTILRSSTLDSIFAALHSPLSTLFSRLKQLLLLPVFISLLAIILAACSAEPDGLQGYEMYPLEDMPQEVKAAPVAVQQAYQFAAANAQVMTQIPCYCGCGDIGHTSNYACYVSATDAQGKPVFDNHALGCSICVDITLDVMRLLAQGKTVGEIRSYVDQTYARYGPSNMP